MNDIRQFSLSDENKLKYHERVKGEISRLVKLCGEPWFKPYFHYSYHGTFKFRKCSVRHHNLVNK